MYASARFRLLGGRNILRSAPGCWSSSVQRVGSSGSGFQVVPSHNRTATLLAGAGLKTSCNKDRVMSAAWSVVFVVSFAMVCSFLVTSTNRTIGEIREIGTLAPWPKEFFARFRSLHSQVERNLM